MSFTPAMELNSSPARCAGVPWPEEAKLISPGLALASAISSFTVRARSDGWTTSTLGVEAASVTGARSGRAHQHRVSVGRGLGDDVGADIAARAGPVVDHDLLREALGELLRDDASDDVGAAARREGDDEADRLGGIGVRRRGRLRRQCRERRRERQSGAAALHFLFFLAAFLSPCFAKYSRAVRKPPSAAG